MIIDKLITLFGFEIDEKTLLRYKKLLTDVQKTAKRTSEKVKDTFEKAKPSIREAERAVWSFRQGLKETGRVTVILGQKFGRTFNKINRRISRTASNLLRLRSLLGVSIAAILGVQAVGSVASAGFDVERTELALGSFNAPQGETEAQRKKRVEKQREQIRNIALNTAFGLQEAEETFLSLTRRGIDAGKYTEGIINAAAKFGGTREDIKGALLQLGQGFAKDFLDRRDFNVLLEKRLPIQAALRSAIGDPNKTEIENNKIVDDAITKRIIGRKELIKVFEFFNKEAEEFKKEQKKLSSFQLNQLKDFLEVFKRTIAESGFSQALGDVIREINVSITEAVADGSFKETAQTISNFLVKSLKALVQWIKNTVILLQHGEHWTQKITDRFGGFVNTLKVLLGLAVAVWLAPLISLVFSLTVALGGLVVVLWRFVAALSFTGAVSKATGALSILITSFRVLKAALIGLVVGAGTLLKGMLISLIGLFKSFAVASAAFMMTPIGRIITLIGALIGAGIALARNWDEVLISVKNFGTYLQTEFPVATNIVLALLTGIKKTALLLLDPFIKLWELLSDLPAAWQTMKDAASDALDAIAEKLKPVVSGIKKISDSTFGVVGKFIGETAAKAVIGAKKLFGDDEPARVLASGLAGNIASPLTPSVTNNAGQNTTTVDSGTVMNVDINVQGRDNDFETGQRIAQAITDQSKRVNINSTTTVKY